MTSSLAGQLASEEYQRLYLDGTAKMSNMTH